MLGAVAPQALWVPTMLRVHDGTHGLPAGSPVAWCRFCVSRRVRELLRGGVRSRLWAEGGERCLRAGPLRWVGAAGAGAWGRKVMASGFCWFGCLCLQRACNVAGQACSSHSLRVQLSSRGRALNKDHELLMPALMLPMSLCFAGM